MGMDFEREDSVFTFYVNEDDKATITCPGCRFEKVVDAAPLRETSASLSVRCKCGKDFRAVFEFRKGYRKKVKLEGAFVNLTSGDRGQILLVDLSMNGAGFFSYSKHSSLVGDVVDLSFTLDNRQQTKIERKAVVTQVEADRIHVRFKGQSRDADLGFYLMP